MSNPTYDELKAFLFEDEVGADTYQVDGSHYKDMAIEPWDLMEVLLTHHEFCGYLKGACIKYAMRAGKKQLSPKDAEKYKHYKQKLRETKAAHLREL